jgi:hypothetical protein
MRATVIGASGGSAGGTGEDGVCHKLVVRPLQRVGTIARGAAVRVAVAAVLAGGPNKYGVLDVASEVRRQRIPKLDFGLSERLNNRRDSIIIAVIDPFVDFDLGTIDSLRPIASESDLDIGVAARGRNGMDSGNRVRSTVSKGALGDTDNGSQPFGGEQKEQETGGEHVDVVERPGPVIN